MRIGKRTLGIGHPVYIIAEASANHCQNLDMARRLVIEAANAGADAVKFQTYDASELAAKWVALPRGHSAEQDAMFDHLHVETLQQLLAGGGLPRAWHAELHDLATFEGIDFLSTPFSVDAARFLVEDVQVKALKIASGDLTFEPLLDYANTTKIPVILSTGGATLDEIYAAVTRLEDSFVEKRLALLHCVSEYPLEPEHANLRAISTLRELFSDEYVQVGWSDHTLSAKLIPSMAVALGATIIEKHFRLPIREYDRLTSADERHSLNPQDFSDMVKAVRRTEQILGDGVKAPQPGELHDRLWARRSSVDWLRPTKEARAGKWE